jgi:hypothetical protein
MTRSILATALLLSLASPARAQQVVPAPQASTSVCFRGRPLPRCRAFWLTEFGVSPFDGAVAWELGGMRNVGPRSAVGGALYLRVDGGSAYGVKPRFRRWLSPVVALDVAPGFIILAGDGNSPGFAGHVGLSFRDWLALTLQAETVPPDFPAGRRIKWSGGGRLGGGLGAITGIAGLALLGWYALACGGRACFD